MSKQWRTAGLCSLLLVGGRALGSSVLGETGGWLGGLIGTLAAALVFVLSFPPRTSRRLHAAVLATGLAVLAAAAMPESLGLALMVTHEARQPGVLALWSWTWPALLLVLHTGWGRWASHTMRGLNLGLAVFFVLYAVVVSLLAMYYPTLPLGLA